MDSLTRPALESIAGNVRRLRQALGQTQEELATSAGIDSTFLQRIERGSTNLSVAVLVRLARALGTSAAELLRPATLPPRRRGRPRRR